MAHTLLLAIVASVPVARGTGTRITMTRKFLQGMEEHVRLWPGGRVRVIAEQAADPGDNLDNVEVDADELPFELALSGFAADAIRPHLADAQMVLMMLYHRQAHLAGLCRELGVASAYVSEYTLRTRLQINGTNTHNLAKRVAKDVLERWRERGLHRAVEQADGLQCNGTPTFDAYRSRNAAPMLFFDTRVTRGLLAEDAVLQKRFERRRARESLHLAFSGRLIAMKGADHLIAVAQHLRELGRAFTLSICGDGTLEPRMRQRAAHLRLNDQIVFRGTMDFARELVPFMRDEVDVFVCCHRQGDPSCTYLETMSCGVPIAGYDNEAFAGLAAVSGTGWASPLDRPDALAARIAALDDAAVEQASRRSLSFASEHLFETEFERRMDHLAQLAESHRSGNPNKG